MAFLIPDNLASRKDVVSAHRRVANAFRTGLDETITCWYEPLFDPKGKKPHFVVMLPERGVVVLEVFGVKAKGVLGALRGKIRLERDDKEVAVDNPLVRADHFAGILRKRIEQETRLQELTIPVAAGAVFPFVTKEDAQDKGLTALLPEDRCVYRAGLDAAIDEGSETELLRGLVRILNSKEQLELDEDAEKILRGLIQPDTVIGADSGDKVDQLTIFRPPDDKDDVIRVMDRKQEALAKSLGDGHRVIRGVAGSGKTLILVYRAKLLARLSPRYTVLVTCYTRSLAGQLKALLRDYDNVDVVHLDRLMAKVIREAGEDHPGYEDDGESVAKVALKASQKGIGPRYRAVLLDEAQDFSTTALRFAVSLLEPGYDDLIIVADAAQQIFKRNASWKSAGIQAQGRTRLLRINYRNTKEIVEFATSFLGIDGGDMDEIDIDDETAIIPAEACERRGEKPVAKKVDCLDDAIQHTVATAANWAKRNSDSNSIAVLYPASYEDGRNRGYLLYKNLQEAGLDVFWLSDKKSRNRDLLAESLSPVVLTTIHSAKGLEFPRVVVCGLSRDGSSEDMNRKLAYVGMTRATHLLEIVATDDDPLCGDLMRAAEKKA